MAHSPESRRAHLSLEEHAMMTADKLPRSSLHNASIHEQAAQQPMARPRPQPQPQSRSASPEQLELEGAWACPSPPLINTRLRDNVYVWGDAAFSTTAEQHDPSHGPRRGDLPRPTGPSSTPTPTTSHTSTTHPDPDPHPRARSAAQHHHATTDPDHPVSVPGRWAALSLGDSHAAAVSCRGDLYTWGSNRRGQLGLGHEHVPSGAGPSLPWHVVLGSGAAARGVPSTHVAAHVPVRAVACGGEHTLAVTAAGVWAWGDNGLGQLGLGHGAPAAVWRPELVPGLRGTAVRQVAAGRAHSLCVTVQAQVLVWGGNGCGQLGLGDRRPRAAPAPVDGLWALPVVAVAAGDAHSAAVTSSGHAFMWGANHYGQLGLLPDPSEHPAAAAAGAGAGGPVGGGGGAGGVGGGRVTLTGYERLDGVDGGGGAAAAAVMAAAPGTLRRSTVRRHAGGAPVPSCRPNPQWLLTMQEMGIPRRHAEVALEETGNAGVEVATEWLFASDRSALLDELCGDTRTANTHPGGRSTSSTSTTTSAHHHYHPGSSGSRSSRTTSGAARVTPAPVPYGARQDGVRGSSRADEPQARASAAASGRNASGYGDRSGSAAAAAEGLQHLQRRLQPQQQGSQYTCSTPPRAPAAAAAGTAARAGTGLGHGHVAGGSPRHPSGRWSDTGCGAVGGAGGSSSGSGAWGWQVVEVGAGAHGEGAKGGGVCVNTHGGQQDDPLLVLEPRRVPLKGVRQLCAGSRHTVAVTDGGVFAWGEGREGALGLGDTEDRDLPARVNCLAVSHASVGHVSAGTRAGARSSGGGGGVGGGEVVGVVRRVACGSRHTLFLVEGGGVLWCGTMRGVGAGGVGRQEEQEGQRAERLSLVPVKLQGIMEPEGAGGAAPGSSAGHGTGGVAGGGVAAAVPGGGVVVYDVVARGGGSGALACLAGELSAEASQPLGGCPLLPQLLATLDCAAEARAAGVDAPTLAASLNAVTSALETVLSSPAAISAAFGRRRGSGGGAPPPVATATAVGRPLVGSSSGGGSNSYTSSSSSSGSGSSSSSWCMGLDGPLFEGVMNRVLALFSDGGGEYDTAAGGAASGGGEDAGKDRHSADESSLQRQLEDVPGGGAARQGRSNSAAAAAAAAAAAVPAAGAAGGGSGGGLTLHRYRLAAALERSLGLLAEDLAAHARQLGAPERAQVLLAALQHPLLADPACCRRVLPRLAATALAAPPVVRTWLVRWWADYPGPLLRSRVVAPMQAYLTRELGATKKLTTSVMNVIRMLARVAEAAALSRSLPPEALYNALISDKLDVADHYTAWRQARELAAGPDPPLDAPFSFCSFPFLLDARAKSHLLQVEARFQMEQSVAHARMEAQLYGSAASASARGSHVAGGSGSHVSGGTAGATGRGFGRVSGSGAASGSGRGGAGGAGGRAEELRVVDYSPGRRMGGAWGGAGAAGVYYDGGVAVAAGTGQSPGGGAVTAITSSPFSSSNASSRSDSPGGSSGSSNGSGGSSWWGASSSSSSGATTSGATSSSSASTASSPSSATSATASTATSGRASLRRSTSSSGSGGSSSGSGGSSSSTTTTATANGRPAWAGGGGGGGGLGSYSRSLRSLLSLLGRAGGGGGGGGGSSIRRSATGGEGLGAGQQQQQTLWGAGGGVAGRGRSASVGTRSGYELPRPSECSMPGAHSDVCIIRVRRTHMVADAAEEMGRQFRRDLLKPLRVHFIGEEGIDAGGVKKEFLQLLVGRLLDPAAGLMAYDEDSRTYWFNPSCPAPHDGHHLLGVAVGLAVYNRVLLDLPAPPLLWAKLRGGREMGLRDLEGWRPELARGIRQILEYDGPDPLYDVFGLTFAVDVPRPGGGMATVPLKPGGEHIPVTEDNRAEYAHLLTAWHTGGSVEGAFDAFAGGFKLVCHGPAMELFNEQELERLVCGNPRLDFYALRGAARYEGGYTAHTPAVGWLWDVVLHDFSPQDQRAFLKFFTGSDRAPIGGLGTLRATIQRDGPDSHKLPTSHTCFNTLLLPEYASRDKMASLLRLAINNSEGFGLQ